MVIQFHCQECGKSLQTTDDKAGRHGRCPECRAPLVVPAHSNTSADGDRIESVENYEEHESADDRITSGNRSQTCPMCGAQNVPSALRCSQCGEELQPDSVRNRQFEDGNLLIFSQIINQTVSRFESNIGLCISGVVLTFAAMVAAVAVLQFCLVIVGTGTIRLLRNPGDVGGAIVTIFILGILAIVCLNCWIVLGLNQFLLKLARFGKASIDDLFSVSFPRVWSMVFNTVVFAALAAGVVIGTVIFTALSAEVSPILFLITGGIGFGLYVMLILAQWCYPYVILDRNPPGLGPLTTTFRLMSGNYLTVFLLLFCLTVLNIIGAIMMGIGLLFTIPFSLLALAVAYDQMTHSDSL